jgi:hypothetical protein
MAEPETQLRLVGRLQAVEDSIKAAMLVCPNQDMHTIDLLVLSQDAIHRAVMHVWSTTPPISDTKV